MGRVRSIIAAVAVLAVVGGGGMTPAQAGPPPESFNDFFGSFPVTVNGSYLPIGGRLDCTDGGQFAIIWYAPGAGADWRWTDFSFGGSRPVDYSSATLSVNGTYEPFVGDFDGDGCGDVFWYAPGSGADYLWYGVDGGGFVTRAVTVNGDYAPLVGDWDGGAAGDDIFWYGAGGGTESIWRGSTNAGSFGLSTAPQVTGTDYLVSSSGAAALFYRPGPAADYLWEGLAAGASAPSKSIQTTINGVYEPHGFASDNLLLYGPGAAKDTLIVGYDDSGSLETVDGTINGTYRVAVSPTRVIVFHAPGPAPDYLWVLGGGGA